MANTALLFLNYLKISDCDHFHKLRFLKSERETKAGKNSPKWSPLNLFLLPFKVNDAYLRTFLFKQGFSAQ